MSYDPNRTTVLPDLGFPITEELPVVGPGRGRGGPGGRGFLIIAAVLLMGAMIAIAAVLIVGNRQSNQAATGDGAIANPTPVFEPEDVAAPTPIELEDIEPGYWQVTGVADGLNVRAGPGTDNDIVGALRAGDRHIFGTGERATVNGAEWTQIAFGDSDTVGWVSSRFLATDTPPDPNAPTPTPVPSTSFSVVCFESDSQPARVARLEFANRTDITGVIRTIEGDVATDQTVTGTLSDGRALMTLSNPATGTASQGTWTFSPANVALANGTRLSVVNCTAVEGLLP